MRVLLRAGFDRYSGYGNDAVDLAIWLERAGAQVTPWPISILPGLPREFTRLLERDPLGKKDLMFAFAPPYDLLPEVITKSAQKVIGYTMWERSPLLRSDFNGRGWKKRTDMFSHLDELWVTCPMNVEAFRNVDENVPMRVFPCGIASAEWPEADRDPNRPLRFLMVGMLAGRKDPFLAMEAWRQLKQEIPGFDAEFRLHTLAHGGVHPRAAEAYGPDMTITTRALSRDELVRMYHDHDVMVSVSRGEGNNKPAMEFMATGGAVIATDWSGHQNWLRNDVGWKLPVELRPCPTEKNAVEAFTSVEDVKAAFLSAWKDRRGVRERGRRAARWIRDSHDWSVICEKMMRRMVQV